MSVSSQISFSLAPDMTHRARRFTPILALLRRFASLRACAARGLPLPLKGGAEPWSIAPLQRLAQREIVAHGAGRGMLAALQCRDTVEEEARGPAPDDDVAVRERNALLGIGALG